jgi:hypothetical protein
MKQTRFKRLHFLVPDDKNGDFITKYSTCGSYIRLANKKLRHLSENFQEGILYPKVTIRRCGFLSRILLKIHWKMRLRSASAIMPIYRDSEVICLILFSDRLVDDWFSKHSHCVNVLQCEITYCLEVILLYNQTLERIIREYDRSNRRPAGCVDQLIDEQASVLIGKKVEFL